MKATFAFLQQTINKILNEIDDSTSTTKKYFEQKPLRLRRQSRTRREKRKKKKRTDSRFIIIIIVVFDKQTIKNSLEGELWISFFYECVCVGRFAMKDVERDTDWDKETGARLILRLYWIAFVYYENFYGLKQLSFAILNDIIILSFLVDLPWKISLIVSFQITTR